MLCPLEYKFDFIGDKIAANHFKDKITSSLKGNDRFKFSRDVALNRVIEKGKYDANAHIKY